jgi:hypothetical protein
MLVEAAALVHREAELGAPLAIDELGQQGVEAAVGLLLLQARTYDLQLLGASGSDVDAQVFAALQTHHLLAWSQLSHSVMTMIAI